MEPAAPPAEAQKSLYLPLHSLLGKAAGPSPCVAAGGCTDLSGLREASGPPGASLLGHYPWDAGNSEVEGLWLYA